MTTALAIDINGNALTGLAVATEAQLRDAARHTPCPLALVVISSGATGDVLFGLNRWRQQYELPGGIVEEGESFFDAAERELLEETAIRAEHLELVGYARFSLANPRREELGAIYRATVTDPVAQVSDELSAFVWRTPLEASTLAISALDDAIAEWATTIQ